MGISGNKSKSSSFFTPRFYPQNELNFDLEKPEKSEKNTFFHVLACFDEIWPSFYPQNELNSGLKKGANFTFRKNRD